MFHLSCLLGRLTSSVQRAMTSASKPIVIFVLGGPGAGKGTQCERIVQVILNFVYVGIRGAGTNIMRNPLVRLFINIH